MKKTKSFTMIEVLVTAILISIGLLTVFKVMNYAKRINQKVAETTIANQLATEGTEIIYQIRNTNFLKYENNKQAFLKTCSSGYDECIANFKKKNDINRCRLALDYEECINKPDKAKYLGTGCYYITNTGGKNILNEYTNINSKTLLNDGNIDLKDKVKNNDDKLKDKQVNKTITDCNTNGFINEFAICLNSGTWIPCTGGHQKGGDESKYGKYFRSIKGQGTFDMSSNTTGGTILKSNELSGSQAQEYRFCSYVSRQSIDNGSIEICSTMTNFID